MRLHRLAFPLCLVASTAFVMPVAAQPSTPSTTAVAATDRARSLHVEGARLFELGKYDDAYVAFVAAWALKKHPQIAGNLADCETKIGKYRDAAEHFAFVVRDPNHQAKPEEKRLAQERLKEVQTRIGTLAVSVSASGAEVTLDGKTIGTSPLEGPIFVEPGAHVVEATLKGYTPARAPVDAAKGSAREVTLTLEVLREPPGVPSSPKRSSTPGIVLGAVGGAAAIAGVGLLVGSSLKVSSASQVHDLIAKAGRSCTVGAPSYDARCGGLATTSRDANTFRNAGAGFLIGAGVAAAAAATYLLWPQRSASDAPASSLRLAPAASTSGAGVIFLGTF